MSLMQAMIMVENSDVFGSFFVFFFPFRFASSIVVCPASMHTIMGTQRDLTLIGWRENLHGIQEKKRP